MRSGALGPDRSGVSLLSDDFSEIGEGGDGHGDRSWGYIIVVPHYCGPTNPNSNCRSTLSPNEKSPLFDIMREIIDIPMDQLPHCSSSSEASGSMPRHTTVITSLSAIHRSAPPTPQKATTSASSMSSSPSSSSASGSKSVPPTKPRLPPRPTFGRQQQFDSTHTTYTQLASGIARVQAQPHKPKRPSPLHSSISPESISPEIPSTSDESSPEIMHVEHSLGLGVIKEEKGNMLGLDLEGWNWYGDFQERMKDPSPRTPFSSPAIYA